MFHLLIFLFLGPKSHQLFKRLSKFWIENCVDDWVEAAAGRKMRYLCNYLNLLSVFLPVGITQPGREEEGGEPNATMLVHHLADRIHYIACEEGKPTEQK